MVDGGVDIGYRTLEPVYSTVLGEVVPEDGEEHDATDDDDAVVHFCCIWGWASWEKEDDA